MQIRRYVGGPLSASSSGRLGPDAHRGQCGRKLHVHYSNIGRYTCYPPPHRHARRKFLHGSANARIMGSGEGGKVMAGRWWRGRRCGAKTRKGKPCVAKALPSGRYPNHGGMSTGPNTEAGKRHRAAETRAWWARWDPKAHSRYMSAVVSQQVDKMRRIRRAELARQQREGLR
jgi:hypothetical protein